MSSEPIHTVFISSTFEDLREERAEVQKAILRLGCLPIGMELFPSADSNAWGFICGEIERSDYYILIVGGRYGSVDTDGISYTEKEYRLARELDKPSLVFARSSSALVSQDKNEQDEDKRKRLQSFITDLNKARLVQRFSNPHQLGADSYFSLNELRKKRPAAGYARVAKQTLSPAAGVSLAKWDELTLRCVDLEEKNGALQAENAALRQTIKTMPALGATESLRALQSASGPQEDAAAKAQEKSGHDREPAVPTRAPLFPGYELELLTLPSIRIPEITVGLGFVAAGQYPKESGKRLAEIHADMCNTLTQHVFPWLELNGKYPRKTLAGVAAKLPTLIPLSLLREKFIGNGLIERSNDKFYLTSFGADQHFRLLLLYKEEMPGLSFK